MLSWKNYGWSSSGMGVVAMEFNDVNLMEKEFHKNSSLTDMKSPCWEIQPMSIAHRPSVIDTKISIIIPVKNAGLQLRQLMSKIRSQRKVADVEIIVVDSGSRDSSAAIAGEFGATVLQIEPHEFNHGGTRNLGARAAKGDFLVFTVQDAMPASDYWLYNMVCPFLEYSQLAALSARQIVRPEADLYSLWAADAMSRLLSFDGDVIYRHSPDCLSKGVAHLDNRTKRRLTFFDDVSSCIRASIFREMQFSPLMNAEDIDYGARLFTEGREIGYLAKCGVYHWHERGADHVFKLHYLGTKASIYTLKNDLGYFFNINSIGLEKLICCMTGAYELINAAVSESEKKAADRPVARIKAFLAEFRRFLDEPCEIPAVYSLVDDSTGQLALLMRQIAAHAVISPEEKYEFKNNFLIPVFISIFNDFAYFICNSHETLEGREQDFNDTIIKIFAQSAGTCFGIYYIEEETLGRLTPTMMTSDHLLGKGITY
jgi:glycosyltransferase involved in cell wall biosynthesis